MSELGVNNDLKLPLGSNFPLKYIVQLSDTSMNFYTSLIF